MRGRKFSSPKDNNSDAIAIKNVIQEIAQEEIRKFGFPTYKAAIVRKINEDGTVDCYLPPNEDNLVTGILNKCGELLFVGDSVELETKNGSLTNCWVAIKHGTNVQGQAEEVENLSGEVVMKVQNGRLSVTELNRDAVLGNAFTIIAEDINLDGMNIVLNGSRGITISSPYFNVTSQGYITATGGKIGGWEMGATRLYSGSGANYVALDSGTANVNYPIWAGNENPVNAPFSVTRAGYLKSTSGTIGGWSINNSTLTGGNITLNSNGSISGGSTYGWSIGTDGYATFNGITGNNATISGNITTGNLNATGGNIGGWAIDSVQFHKQIGEYSFEIRSDRASNEPALLVYKNQGGSQGYKFYVRPDGYLYATSGTFAGSLDGATGTFRGSMTAGSLNINNRFKVDSNGAFYASTSGGGYLSMGTFTDYPFASGLNIGSAGLAIGSTSSGNLYLTYDGNYSYFRSAKGLSYVLPLDKNGNTISGVSGGAMSLYDVFAVVKYCKNAGYYTNL